MLIRNELFAGTRRQRFYGLKKIFSLHAFASDKIETMKKTMHGLILVFLFVSGIHCSPSKYGVPDSNKRKLLTHSVWNIYLQPYQNTTIEIDGKRVAYRILTRDKTFAQVRLKIPVYQDKLGFKMAIKNSAYQTKEHFILPAEHPEWVQEDINRDRQKGNTIFFIRGKKPFYGILDKKGSMLRFHSYYKMGSRPKAVTFIKKREIVMPLLSDKGIEVINIWNHSQKRIAPPAAYAKKTGFVETLVLPEKNEFWVSQMMTASAHAFDLNTHAYKKTVDAKAKWSKVLAYNKADNKIYMSNWLSKNVSVIDPDKKVFLYNIYTGGIPRGLEFSNDGKYLYAAQFGINSGGDIAGRVLKIDLKTRKIVKRIGPRGAKRHMVKSKKHNLLFVSDLGKRRVDVIDLGKDQYKKSITVFNSPNTIALSHDENYLFVSCRGPNNPRGYQYKGLVFGRIYVIDVNTLKVVEFIEGGNQPTGLDVAPDDRYVVFSDFLDNAIRVYRFIPRKEEVSK